MFRTLLWIVVATATLTGRAYADSGLVLADAGTSDYAVLLPDDASEVQVTAAEELRDYVRQVADVEIPTIREEAAAQEGRLDAIESAKLLIIGPSATSRKILGETESSIGYDGIILKRVGNSIVFSGAPGRGPLYAVYEFLERELGIRWLTAAETTVPRAKNGRLEIDGDLDVVYAPKILSRESYYLGAFDGVFAARSRCNGDRAPIPPQYGGRRTFAYGVHSSFALISPLKYFIDHPDWFSEIDGVRKVCLPGDYSQEYKEFVAKVPPEQIAPKGTQLCFSNDEMIAELVKNARETLRADPTVSFLDVSQNDWDGWCQCEKCRAADEEDGSHIGSILRAVNKVAEALEDEFPDLLVETLAYKYSRTPPAVTKPRKNVLIRLCSIECSFAEPIDSEVNKSFRDDLLAWSAVADNLFVWDYATDFGLYLLPFPNYRVLAPNLRTFAQNHVVGVFEQGDYHSPTGDFVELRNWVVSKLMWNPDLDPKALRDDFVSNYYAPELVPIYRDYFDVLSDAVERSGVHLDIYRMDVRDWLGLDDLNRATRLQNQALEIAEKLERENPEMRKRLVDKVERGRIPIELVWLQEYKRFRAEAQERGVEFLGPADPLKAAQEFVAKLDKYGFTRHREACWKEYYEQFRRELVAQFEDGVDDSTETP